MAYKKGNIPWTTGKKHSKETKKKMSESHRGITPWNKDKPFLAISGNKHYRWGKHCSEEIKSKISRSKIGKYLKENNPNWKGGKIDFQGYYYIYMPNHPHSSREYIAEHRLIMEKHLGRYLKPNEFIHHKDGNKKNNRFQNLELTTKRRHKMNNYQAFQYGYKKGFTEAFLLFMNVLKFKEKGEKNGR